MRLQNVHRYGKERKGLDDSFYPDISICVVLLDFRKKSKLNLVVKMGLLYKLHFEIYNHCLIKP